MAEKKQAKKETVKKEKKNVATPVLESVKVKDVKATNENEETVTVEANVQLNTTLESVETTFELEANTDNANDTETDENEPSATESTENESGEQENENDVTEDIEDIDLTNSDLKESQDKLSKSLSAAKTTEEAKNLIEKEIKKMEDLKAKTEKIIKKYSNMQISNSWNGMIEDW